MVVVKAKRRVMEGEGWARQAVRASNAPHRKVLEGEKHQTWRLTIPLQASNLLQCVPEWWGQVHIHLPY